VSAAGEALVRELAEPHTAIRYRRQSAPKGYCARCDRPRRFGDRVVLVKRGSTTVFAMHEDCWTAFRAETGNQPELRVIPRRTW
jgi:hypothetical protein